MDISGFVSADSLFINANQQQSQLESVANQALSAGIDRYMAKDYDGAVKDFQRAIGLAPNSTHSITAAKYKVNAHLKLDQTEKAIQTYQTTIDFNRDRDDLRIELGNLYFAEDRYEEARMQYQEAVRINPVSNNYYSLGQAFLKTEEFTKAEIQFQQVLRLDPEKPNGNFGLGQTYSQEGNYKKAIAQFENAIQIQPDFYDAYAEIGYAYSDLGQMEEAEEILELLEEKDESIAGLLEGYINKVAPPKMLFAWATSSFSYKGTMNTQVANLDSYLENSDASKLFTMEFQFDKSMDRKSVEDIFNWSIGRSTDTGPAMGYNFGQPVDDTEITIDPYPVNVYYDAEILTATVTFMIKQNENGDGTIDPGHIEFKFNGSDQYGIAIDSDYDQYTGFSGMA